VPPLFERVHYASVFCRRDQICLPGFLFTFPRLLPRDTLSRFARSPLIPSLSLSLSVVARARAREDGITLAIFAHFDIRRSRAPTFRELDFAKRGKGLVQTTTGGTLNVV